jgi:hypothetical protein
VGHLPPSYGTCDTLKPNLANAFAQATQVDVLSIQCESDSLGSKLTINYVESSSQPLIFTTTTYTLAGDDVAGRGYMKTEDECQARKEVIVEQFKTATGLNPFITYCKKELRNNSHRWHVAIDAVGAGKMSYYFVDELMSDGVSTDPSALISEVNQYFQTRSDVIIVDTVMRTDDLNFTRLGVAMFAAEPIKFSKETYLAVSSDTDCAFEAAELKAAATRAGLGVIGHGCQFRHADFNKTFLLTEGRKALSFDSTGITYESMEACRAARNNLFQDLHRRIGNDVVGVHCSDGFLAPTAFALMNQRK